MANSSINSGKEFRHTAGARFALFLDGMGEVGTLQEVSGGSLKSSWYGDCLPSRDFPMLIDFHLQGRIDLQKFVSETIALDAVEEAFHKMERGEVLRSVVLL